MTLQLTWSSVIQAGAVVTALGAVTAAVVAVGKWFVRQGRQDDDIREIRDEQRQMQAEQCVISFALLACLDGLKQLGANGNVTEAHNKLEKHLNKKAHDIE